MEAVSNKKADVPTFVKLQRMLPAKVWSKQQLDINRHKYTEL